LLQGLELQLLAALDTDSQHNQVLVEVSKRKRDVVEYNINERKRRKANHKSEYIG